MSQYEETFSIVEVECPYCANKYQRETEDYSEDERVEQCDQCGKKYHTYDQFDVTHHATPDCRLNGMQHIYEDCKLTDGRRVPFCTVCGGIMPMSERGLAK